MKRLLQALVLSSLAAGPLAQADCKDKLDEVQEKARQLELKDDFRQQLRQLHRSAMLLAENGEEKLCADVAKTMASMVDKRQKAIDRRARRQALRNAPRVTSMKRIVGVDSLVDSTVYDPEGEELGTLSAVTVDASSGKVAYVVLTYGGFLGFGKKLIPIPFQELRMTEERGSLVLDISRDVLDEAEGVQDEPWPLRPSMPGQQPAAQQ